MTGTNSAWRVDTFVAGPNGAVGPFFFLLCGRMQMRRLICIANVFRCIEIDCRFIEIYALAVWLIGRKSGQSNH